MLRTGDESEIGQMGRANIHPNP
ncbi:hypothetical protein CKAH01_07359 [Colletotrichum kahawae]|uniref:Uncharacterized protein n=1 Tax=Colletotrichum kahawae TaxID=34407 RepID=A0AAE0D1R8_COLKA|nr:hypothetical protein CKAH01_07359 [Colletotrichum kahawae]